VQDHELVAREQAGRHLGVDPRVPEPLRPVEHRVPGERRQLVPREAHERAGRAAPGAAAVRRGARGLVVRRGGVRASRRT
jgi:hypothetical protein